MPAEDILSIVVIPLILSVVGGITVVIVEYWVIQPIRERQNYQQGKEFRAGNPRGDVGASTDPGKSFQTDTRKRIDDNAKVMNNKASPGIFAIIGIYPFNLTKIMLTLIFASLLLLTAGAVSFERAPEKFLGLMAISGFCSSVAGGISFYIDRRYFGYMKAPLWQKIFAVVITLFSLFFMPFYALIAIYTLLNANY